MPEVDGVLGEGSLKHNGVGVVIVPVLAGVYQGCHKAPDDRGILELVAACANGHIEAGQ